MFKELQSKKNSKQIIPNEKEYKIVEYKLQLAQEPNMTEIRKWFIFKAEKIYSTKMLGTQVVYCNKTFNKIKEKYQFNNLALAAKLDVWLIKYKQLGYDGIFDFSKLNTDWILHNLDANISNYKSKQTSYQNNNVNQINTVNRRI